MTIQDIKRANNAAGHFFFDPPSMRYFQSRVSDKVHSGNGGVFFITSEQFRGSIHTGPRRYTIRSFDPATGDCDTVGTFQEYHTAATAHRHAEKMAQGN